MILRWGKKRHCIFSLINLNALDVVSRGKQAVNYSYNILQFSTLWIPTNTGDLYVWPSLPNRNYWDLWTTFCTGWMSSCQHLLLPVTQPTA